MLVVLLLVVFCWRHVLSSNDCFVFDVLDRVTRADLYPRALGFSGSRALLRIIMTMLQSLTFSGFRSPRGFDSGKRGGINYKR